MGFEGVQRRKIKLMRELKLLGCYFPPPLPYAASVGGELGQSPSREGNW